MLTLIHSSFSDSDDKVAMALQFANPLTGSRYTFHCGLVRERRSNLDGTESFTKRMDDYRRSIELSANP
ncbi:Hypothetical protein NGAL_HAMBI2605_66390 [Neorhizobium galegae bv. orientalis]|nr:Hypothetical protein NGAL_HAMBI2605_66390 [Neorhizobium galegae bv. orientalis]